MDCDDSPRLSEGLTARWTSHGWAQGSRRRNVSSFRTDGLFAGRWGGVGTGLWALAGFDLHWRWLDTSDAHGPRLEAEIDAPGSGCVPLRRSMPIGPDHCRGAACQRRLSLRPGDAIIRNPHLQMSSSADKHKHKHKHKLSLAWRCIALFNYPARQQMHSAESVYLPT
ncbi:hypothetical protein BO71DRAFT_400183 [Aspergillus ellipticus CBS 707.79]|uniref:Uncharacterized protein n=1 Tax=Aspergillus ellipticus CBS 707.79 TaxID=1448320 RepID=A0A319DNM0_9EURO|nr:hypothetical protein BO71DRAFT_400183 [Aspergillus ellipticus CBS 707.79]